jgi:hypothetical protein
LPAGSLDAVTADDPAAPTELFTDDNPPSGIVLAFVFRIMVVRFRDTGPFVSINADWGLFGQDDSFLHDGSFLQW